MATTELAKKERLEKITLRLVSINLLEGKGPFPDVYANIFVPKMVSSIGMPWEAPVSPVSRKSMRS